MTLRLCLPLAGAALAVLPLLAASTRAEPSPAVSAPITHENIAVYFLRGASAPGPVPDTLQEAMAKGSVELHETGTVQELKIRNGGDRPVFVQAGDIVKGGQQDRVLTMSMIIDPKSGLIPIGAYCVERGRWAARGKEDVKRFAAADELMPSREAKVAILKPQLPRPPVPAGAVPQARTSTEPQRGQPDEVRQRVLEQRQLYGPSDSQGEVWRNVGIVQQKLSEKLAASVEAESSRTSLQLSLENERLQRARAAYLGVLEPAGLKDAEIIGVAIAVNGQIASADIYPSNGLFRKMWPKLARAAATEALAKASPARTEPPAVEAVAQFLQAADKGEVSNRDLPGLATIETRSADKVMRVDARNLAGAVVHRNLLAH